MSVLGKKWFIKNQDRSKDVIAKLLANRKQLLEHSELEIFHDPFLFSDMEKAVSRIAEALKKNERIVIFGDYDVDGLSAVAIVFKILRHLNANVSYRLPNRITDGYGLSAKFVDEFSELNIKLLITVDCGISNAEVIEKALTKGIDTIITDHHTIPSRLPDALAIIHPKKDENYPFSDLTGSAVAFKLAHALIAKFIPENEKESLLNSLVDLACLGVIADLGPLVGENRAIVKKGLEVLGNTKWAGLEKILQLAEVDPNAKIDPWVVGYRIAPRLNAAGRIGDPYLALSLLLQEHDSDKINELGAELEDLNRQRQKMTNDFFAEAEAYFSNFKELPYILIAENPNWHVGILGLIAGKLAEKYARPAIILQDFGDVLVASARSPEYFNITQALTKFQKYLITFGGHACAAGFNIKKSDLSEFKEAITKYADEKLSQTDLSPTLPIDCELEENDICFDLLERLEILEPFGVGNERPTFLINNIKPAFIGQVGKEKEHIKFSFQNKTDSFQVIGFGMGSHAENIREHQNINLVFHVERNYWNGKSYLQLHALDFSFDEK